MKTCVVRVFGPAAANETAPRLFSYTTGSSGIVACSHACDTSG
jgi:RNase P/RNase MRP subunit POP5